MAEQASTPPLDPSILTAAPVQVQAPDILGALRQGQALKAERLANQQTMAGQEGNRLLAQNIDPTTGQVNMPAFGAALHSDPAAAIAAQKAYAEAQNSYGQVLQNHGQTISNALNMLKAHAQLVAPLVDAGPNGITPGMVARAHADAVKLGLATPAEAAQSLANWPNNPQASFALAQQQLQQGVSAERALRTMEAVSQGNQIDLVNGNGEMSSAGQPISAPIQLGMSPSEQTRLVNITGPNGVTQQVPAGQFARVNNIPVNPGVNNPLVQPPAGGGNPLIQNGAPGLPPVNLGPGTFKSTAPVPVAATNLPAPAPSVTLPDGKSVTLNNQAPPAAPGWAGISFPEASKPFTYTGGAVDGPAPGQVEAQQAEIANSTKQYTDLQNSIANASTQSSLLQSLIAEGSKANTGPVAQQIADVGAFAKELGIDLGPQATAEQLTNKDAMQLIAAQSGAFGAPTNEKLASIIEGNPNAKMTGDALRGAAGMKLGNIQYAQAQAQAWDSYKAQAQAAGVSVTPGDFSHFNQQFQKMTSPTVFQWQYLAPQQRAAYLSSLNKSGKEQLLNQMNWAASNGLLNKDAIH